MGVQMELAGEKVRIDEQNTARATHLCSRTAARATVNCAGARVWVE